MRECTCRIANGHQQMKRSQRSGMNTLKYAQQSLAQIAGPHFIMLLQRGPLVHDLARRGLW